MASHFSTIGLVLRSADEMTDLANRVGPDATPLTHPHAGAYFRWSDPSGAELWIQVNADNELIGMNPHFAGKSVVRVGLTARIDARTLSELDGAFHGWADPQTDDIGSGSCPFVFDAPDFRLHDGLTLPAVVRAQIAAFAHEVEAFGSVAEYEASQTGDVKFASQSFIPSGLFKPDGDLPDPPTADAIFTGHVAEAERRENALTGRPFYWALVDTLGGTFDVVIDPELLPDTPKVGGVVSGSFWLTGRIVST